MDLFEKKKIVYTAYHWASIRHSPVFECEFFFHITIIIAVLLVSFRRQLCLWGLLLRQTHEEVPSCELLKINVLSNPRTNLACKTKCFKCLPGHQLREAAGGAPADELLFVWSPPHCCTEGFPKVKALLVSQTLQPPQKEKKKKKGKLSWNYA